jgi:hypothetical protein
VRVLIRWRMAHTPLATCAEIPSLLALHQSTSEASGACAGISSGRRVAVGLGRGSPFKRFWSAVIVACFWERRILFCPYLPSWTRRDFIHHFGLLEDLPHRGAWPWPAAARDIPDRDGEAIRDMPEGRCNRRAERQPTEIALRLRVSQGGMQRPVQRRTAPGRKSEPLALGVGPAAWRMKG